MLVDAIRALFRSEPSDSVPAPTRSDGSPVDPLHLAACALLVEVAWADGEFSVVELEHLEGALERHFALPPGAGRELIGLAEDAGIDVQVEASGRVTGTDADAVVRAGRGVPVGVVSVPTRYLHSPGELFALEDAEACIDLLGRWVTRPR